ncbi:receptor-like protein 7 [Actinidia eriantha]|uniref:receptor-like protein 7 n=1 Tax=Actinidia eriantha TaxID=165200 RepID=UPI002590F88D|nr:receptor-like protein 7 [Actinidia eriantha]
MQPLCHESESSALLQFKHSFFINEYASRDRFAYPKVKSWKLQGNTSDCCSWDGVECDHNTGHVIGLDLSSSFLYGSIDANSSLLSLVHLRRLNLADNHFNYSRIPSGVRRLSRLTSLNLSRSSLIGPIPSEISDLSLLISLDLSKNFDQRNPRFWELQIPSPTHLVQNFTNLKELYLSGVYIPTTIPDILANTSSLTAIGLANCGLYGEFPRSIFQLPNLKILSAGFNQNLTGSLPEFQSSSSRLEVLELGRTSFYGKLPDSIGNLQSLNYLDLQRSDFSGNLPSSLGNLTQLTVLELRVNKFSGQIPFSLANLSQLTTLALGRNYFDEGMRAFPFGKLPKLTTLHFSSMNLQGEFLPSLANLTQLSYLAIDDNTIVGKIPSWLMNLTQLTLLALTRNQLHGPIPSSISQLKQLDFLDLGENRLSGTVELDIFMKLQNLDYHHAT